MPFLRQSYKQKPKQRGPFSAVQSALFHNADRMGIDPASIELAMPMWNPGDQRDYSKNRLVGINNGATYEENSLNFNGSSAYLNTQRTVTYPLTFWAKVTTNSLSVNQCICGVRYNAAQGVGLTFRGGSAGDPLRFTLYGIIDIDSSASGMAPGVEYDLCVTYDQVDVKFYINGRLLSSHARTGGNLSTHSLWIGALNNLESPGDFFNGGMKGFLHFNSALKPSQIAQLSDNPYALWQPVSQKTIFLPLGGDVILPINFNQQQRISHTNIRR